MKKAFFPLCLSAFIVVVDQLVKLLVFSHSTLYETKVLIPHVLEFLYLHNDGAAMGLFSGGRWPLVILTGIMLVVCLAFLLFGKEQRSVLRFALSVIVGGGIGNMIDRIRLGYVIDYVRFPIPWFSYSFNIADCAVCIGAGLLLLDLLLDLLHSIKNKKARIQ